jgi:hypothetical protein
LRPLCSINAPCYGVCTDNSSSLRLLASRIVAVAVLGDVSAADLAAALRVRRREATELLEELEAGGSHERRSDAAITVCVTAVRA